MLGLDGCLDSLDSEGRGPLGFETYILQAVKDLRNVKKGISSV
jgi:hypothetical protein